MSEHPEHDEAFAHGGRLLTAVENLVDDPDNLIAFVEALREEEGTEGSRAFLRVLDRIVDTYSNRSALVGAATAAPAAIPGLGTVGVLVGGALIDMVLLLKHEVEMAACLTYAFGHDIREDRSRWLAYILVGVSTYEAKAGRNYFLDMIETQLEAFSLYTPRELSKMAMLLFGRVTLIHSGRRAVLRAIPLAGIVLGAAANKLMTSHVGWRCVDALERLETASARQGGVAVEAEVV